MRHVLIGGNGYLGRVTVNLFLAHTNDNLVIVDLAESFQSSSPIIDERVENVVADISEPGSLNNIFVEADDIVHHLATRLLIPNHPRFRRDQYFNRCAVTGTSELLKWMKNSNLKQLIFWSTDMVYGPEATIPRVEEDPRLPYGPYGRSKVAAEDLILHAAARDEVVYTIFRPRLIIGEGRLGILKRLFLLIDRGLPVPLIGSGSNSFQFIGVSDCAQAALLASQKGCKNQIYNLGSLNSPSVKELISTFVNQSESRSHVIPVPGMLVKTILRILNLFTLSPLDPEQYEIADQEVTLDIRKAQNELGWMPTENDQDLLLAAYKSYNG